MTTAGMTGLTGFGITAWLGGMAPNATTPALRRKDYADAINIATPPGIRARFCAPIESPPPCRASLLPSARNVTLTVTFY
jgi:hypothetical protein